MAHDHIRYDLLVQQALKGVLRKVLGDVSRDGLKGDHHFYITFRTDHPGVRLSDHMREKYPQSITIVLQHEFWDLGVTEHAFEVGLSFKRIPERLLVPFEAVTEFYDPSVEFGLRFEPVDANATEAKGESETASGKGSVPSLPTAPKARKPASPKPVPVADEPVAAEGRAKRPSPKGAAAKPQAADDDGSQGAAKADTTRADVTPAETAPPPASEPAAEGASIVSLDAFRKKK